MTIQISCNTLNLNLKCCPVKKLARTDHPWPLSGQYTLIDHVTNSTCITCYARTIIPIGQQCSPIRCNVEHYLVLSILLNKTKQLLLCMVRVPFIIGQHLWLSYKIYQAKFYPLQTYNIQKPLNRLMHYSNIPYSIQICLQCGRFAHEKTRDENLP